MPSAAGISYTLAWLCGLTLFASAPGPRPTDAQLDEFYRGHPLSTSLQSVFVHGVAAVALLVVAWVLWSRRLVGTWWLAAASTAATLSFVQLGLDLWRSNGAADPAAVVHVIDRLDGVKMLALGAMTALGTKSLGRREVIGRSLQVLGWVTTVLVAMSGVSYVVGVDVVPLAAAALIGLLLWVPAVAFRAAAAARAAQRPPSLAGVGT
jgi:hypothetical protein